MTNGISITNQLIATANAPTQAGKTVGATGAAATTAGSQIQDQFMKMLVAQIQYQDPTNPMDSAQMTSQLAQINTVDGINQLNSSMTAMSASLQASQTYQAAALIGQTVMAPGSSFNLVNGQASFGVQLPTGASSVMVSILNGSGQTVDSMNLGTQAAGTIPLQWNGQDSTGKALADGIYSLKITANTGGKPVSANGLTYSKVSAVSNNPGAGGAQLVLSNNTTTSLASVTQIK